MRNLSISIILIFLFCNSIIAQTNTGSGVITIRVIKWAYIPSDGEGAPDPRITMSTTIGGVNQTAPCSYQNGGTASSSLPNSYAGLPNTLPSGEQYANAVYFTNQPISDNVSVNFRATDDDSLFDDCNDEDDLCQTSLTNNISTLAAQAAPGVPQYFYVTCGTRWQVGFSITWTVTSPGGTTCADMQPICSSSGINFILTSAATPASPAGDNADGSRNIDACASNYNNPVTGMYYGCLAVNAAGRIVNGASTLSPLWFYMKANTGGNAVFTLTSGADVDYILYGPFRSLNDATALCGRMRNDTDCAWSSASSEVVRIDDAVAGDIYVLMVSNYAGSTQLATFTQTSGSMSLDCNLINACVIKSVQYISKTACNSTNDTYTATVRVEFDLPSGTTFPTNIVVNNQVFSVTSADNTAGFKQVTLTNLPADGLPVSLSAYFQSTPSCAGGLANAWTAPAPCDPCPAKAGNW